MGSIERESSDDMNILEIEVGAYQHNTKHAGENKIEGLVASRTWRTYVHIQKRSDVLGLFYQCLARGHLPKNTVVLWNNL